MLERVVGKINYWLAPFVWKKEANPKVNAISYTSEKPFFDDVPTLMESAINQSYIESNRKYDHLEYIKECTGKYFIDPISGILINDKNELLQDSIIIDHKALYPFYLNYQQTKKKQVKKIPELIVFDYVKGDNYFHFYSDVLGKLYMIHTQLPHLKHLPLVIGEHMYRKKFFQFFLKHKEVSEFNWYVHKEDEVIETEKAYLLQPMPYDMKYWMWIKSLATPYIQPQQAGKKIFINRPPQTGRHIENHEQIHDLVKSLGYEIIDLENKSLEDQIAIFSSASNIISIHGAGMTNLLFCHPGAYVLEIMPDERISSHYYWLSQKFGLHYECILGGKLIQNRLLYPKGKFHLDAGKMKKYLELMEEPKN